MRRGFLYGNFDIIYGAAISENAASIHILNKMGMTKDSNFTIYGSSVKSFSIEKTRYNSLWTT